MTLFLFCLLCVDVDKNLDLVIFVLDQCIDAILHNVLKLDLSSDHATWFNCAYRISLVYSVR